MQPDLQAKIQQDLLRRLGVDFCLDQALVGELFRLVPSGYAFQESFAIVVSLEWSRLVCSFLPGSFSRSLITQMGKAEEGRRIDFASLASILRRHGHSLTMMINEAPFDPAILDQWPKSWRQFSLSARSRRMDLDPENPNFQKYVMDLLLPFAGMICVLIGFEEGEDGVAGDNAEGARSVVTTNRFERRRINREICIGLKGARCKVCGFDFGAVYGSLGDGFIEVHHVIPVSVVGAGYRINPATDLEPLCSNCHAMVHRIDPPLSIDELRAILIRHTEKANATDYKRTDQY